MPQVMTVTGPVDAEQLGVVLPHEHIYLNLMAEDREVGLLNDERLMIEELDLFVRAGGRTLCEVTSNGIDRQPEKLRHAAVATGLNIIMGSGWYRHPYLDLAYFDRHSSDAIAADIISDIEIGVGETGIRAGIIGEIACDQYITPAEERSFRAAARAHRRTGITITTHAARWPIGLAQLDLLAEESVDLRRVIVGHSDMVPDRDYHLALARRGAFVQFDTIEGKSDYDNRTRVESVLSLARQGYLGQILLSQDVCTRSQLRALGGPGYTYVLTHFLPMLREAGLAEEEVHQLVTLNPRRALTGEA